METSLPPLMTPGNAALGHVREKGAPQGRPFPYPAGTQVSSKIHFNPKNKSPRDCSGGPKVAGLSTRGFASVDYSTMAGPKRAVDPGLRTTRGRS
jgi:hypothetical protein